MGYELRRTLREALGPEITGLQRAIALEIADDAKEATRESWVSLEDLARWTAAKDINVVRNALKRLAAAGWEFRVPMGVGKDGRVLFAVPGRRLTFRVPPFEGVATATPKGEPPLPLEPKGVAPAPSEGAPARSERALATPFSSSPHPLISLDPPAPSDRPLTPATHEGERENPATPADRTLTAAQRAIRATAAVSETEETAFINWITQTHKPRGPAWWRTATADLPELAATWRAKQTPATPTTRLRPTGQPCACCGTQAPAACTNNGRPYCTNCTAPCQTCQQAVPDDQLHTGQCLTCLPIERRTRAA